MWKVGQIIFTGSEESWILSSSITPTIQMHNKNQVWDAYCIVIVSPHILHLINVLFLASFESSWPMDLAWKVNLWYVCIICDFVEGSSIRVELRPIVYHISCHQLQRCMAFCKTLLWPLDLWVLPASFIDKTAVNDICCAKSPIIIDPIRCNWHCFGEPSIFLMPSPPRCLSFQNSKVQCRSFYGFCRKISSLQHLPAAFGHWRLELSRDCSPNDLFRWQKNSRRDMQIAT